VVDGGVGVRWGLDISRGLLDGGCLEMCVVDQVSRLFGDVCCGSSV